MGKETILKHSFVFSKDVLIVYASLIFFFPNIEGEKKEVLLWLTLVKPVLWNAVTYMLNWCERAIPKIAMYQEKQVSYVWSGIQKPQKMHSNPCL